MKRAICLMTVIPTVIVAGCGSGGGSTQTQITPPTAQSPKKLSKADFIKQADGYCAELNAALGGVSNGTTSSDPAALARDIGEYYSGMLLHLRDLGTPDDQTGLDEFLSAGEAIVTAEDRVQEAARGGDSLDSAESEVASAESRFASAASAYGFQECGQGPTTTSSGTATAPSTAAPVTPTVTTPTPVAPAPSGGTGGATGTGTVGGTGGGATGTGGGTGGTSGGSGGVGPG